LDLLTPSFTISQSQSIVALSLIYPLHKLPGHTPFSSLYSSVLVLSTELSVESEYYVTTDGQSASLSWNKAPIWGLRPDFYNSQTVAGLLMWGALTDERMGLLFTIGAGPRERSHSRVRVPCDS
jgi:hypothetical protein